eukprot:TRINITY_DN68711_c0_g1_i1.p1 TRINITY_DN68711_c0_g1~~TRINITY_DN68711_c0_g1_i1.p1  ORF type:complete len:167 (+),score=65.22 TRINITY_DN68711_c0_g1_i1:2-502(+)
MRAPSSPIASHVRQHSMPVSRRAPVEGPPILQEMTDSEWKSLVDKSTNVSFISGGGELVEFAAQSGAVSLTVNGKQLLEAVSLKYDPEKCQLVAYKLNDKRGTGGKLPQKHRASFLLQLAAVAAHAHVPYRGFGFQPNAGLVPPPRSNHASESSAGSTCSVRPSQA